MNAKIIQRMLVAAIGPDVYVTPVCREPYLEPRYKHIWQGWIRPRRVELEDDEGSPAGYIWQWKGPRLESLCVTETIWDSNGEDDWSWEETHFCGWNELLRPTNRRYREVEVPQPCRAQVEIVANAIQLVGEVSWGREVALPTGSYHKVRVRNADGEMLWEMDLQSPQHVLSGSTLTLIHASMEMSG